MPEIGIPYVLTGPDGTRAVFNLPSDPDFVGYLDQENGITGLMDSADVRESFTLLVEGDGMQQGNNFFGRRTGTMQGIIWPDPDITSVSLRESKIKRASRGMKGGSPAVLTWTPTGGVQRQLNLYRQSNVRITGRRPKNFLVPLASEDVYQYSAAEASLVLTPTAAAAELGFTSPATDPISDQFNPVAASSSASNLGDAETWPHMRIDGPIQNPTVVQVFGGVTQQIALTCTLNTGDFLLINTKPQSRSVLLGGTSNRYSYYAANFSTNSWWSLPPGTSTIQLLATAYSTGAQLTLYWRHAWE